MLAVEGGDDRAFVAGDAAALLIGDLPACSLAVGVVIDRASLDLPRVGRLGAFAHIHLDLGAFAGLQADLELLRPCRGKRRLRGRRTDDEPGEERSEKARALLGCWRGRRLAGLIARPIGFRLLGELALDLAHLREAEGAPRAGGVDAVLGRQHDRDKEGCCNAGGNEGRADELSRGRELGPGGHVGVVHRSGLSRLRSEGRARDEVAGQLHGDQHEAGAHHRDIGGVGVAPGNNNHNLLVGGGGNDTLIGLDGRDVLNGGPGADTLQGGADNDLYVYVDAADTVVEQASAGNDTVWTREVSFTLPANVENLLLIEGTAARDGIGNALDNVITGNAAHNGLVGGDGNDTLIGGLSDDAMFGGLGNDTYSVDNASDLVGEPFGGGFDTLRSSLPAYVLADGLEALILDPGATWAVGNASDNTLTGNGISNYLIGYGGNDSLTGVGGDTSNDTMIGGLGDDTYQLDSAGDEAIENAGEGSDLIISEAPSYTLPSNLEAMFLGGAGVWGFGNESDNTLAGTLGNYLFGRGGNDYLNG